MVEFKLTHAFLSCQWESCFIIREQLTKKLTPGQDVSILQGKKDLIIYTNFHEITSTIKNADTILRRYNNMLQLFQDAKFAQIAKMNYKDISILPITWLFISKVKAWISNYSIALRECDYISKP